MNPHTKLIGALLWAALLYFVAWGQEYSPVGLPYFDSKIFTTFSRDNGQQMVRIYVQTLNDNLTFVKTDSGYFADVQIEIYLMNEKTDYAFNRTLKKRIVVQDFEATNARDIPNTISTELPIEPGEYKGTVTLLDRNSGKQISHSTSFRVSTPEETGDLFRVSGILFFSQYKADSTGRIVDFVPELTNSFSTDGKFVYAYFTTYNFSSDEDLEIEYAVTDDRGVVVQRNRYFSSPDSPYMRHFVRLNRYYLNRSQYFLEVSVARGEHRYRQRAPFRFYWRYVPNTEEELDLAIRQLKYIADDDSVKYFLKRPYDEKRRFFQRFWARQDPNPDTEANELLEEYYRRVKFANENFSATGISGWLTDRGRIYIKFGQPDDIERHPFEAETYPYEVWRYYGLNKVFLFIDRTGFGDYTLHPNYYFVEYE